MQQEWFYRWLPDYLKPLNDETIEDFHTKEMISEVVELLTDLSSLTELARMDKTFKRTIDGTKVKVRIKMRKISIEINDTKQSPSKIKKKIHLTVFRKRFKSKNGRGKCSEATIYYRKDTKSVVRSIRRSPLFKPIFDAIDMLDDALDGRQNIDVSVPPPRDRLGTEGKEADTVIEQELKRLPAQFQDLDDSLNYRFQSLMESIENIIPEHNLLDIEEKHELNRMVNEEIPQLIEAYQSVSNREQTEKRHDVFTAIYRMEQHVKRINEQLMSTRSDRLDQLLRLNEVRYHDTSTKQMRKNENNSVEKS